MKTILAASLFALALGAPAFAQEVSVPSSQPSVPSTTPGVQTSGDAVGGASILPSDQGNSVLPPAGGGVDGSSTQSITPNSPSSALGKSPDLLQPGSAIDGTISPRTNSGIPGNLNSGGATPGATTTGPASGGNSAF